MAVLMALRTSFSIQHDGDDVRPWRDAEVARILRFGVRADGRAAFPLMEFQLSVEDLTSIVSYLRAQRATAHAVPEHHLTRFGKALMAFAIAPVHPAAAAPVKSPTGATVERGAYLANNVSSCVSCHTNRGPDGALVGPPFGGGPADGRRSRYDEGVRVAQSDA
jgi:mono/diheme cytochrome c family protein